eukprot:2756133-Pyramimonas_sp.AAC.2
MAKPTCSLAPSGSFKQPRGETGFFRFGRTLEFAKVPRPWDPGLTLQGRITKKRNFIAVVQRTIKLLSTTALLYCARGA